MKENTLRGNANESNDMSNTCHTNRQCSHAIEENARILNNVCYPKAMEQELPCNTDMNLNNLFSECLCCNEIPMRDAIESRRYDLVHSNLRSKYGPNDPNEEIPFQNVYMTGLEFSIYNCDWRMAVLFFVQSADPSYNCFDGTIIEVQSKSYSNIDDLHDFDGDNQGPSAQIEYFTHPFFEEQRKNSKQKQVTDAPIPGFPGLHCLLDQSKMESTETYCTLWLMQKCYEPCLPLATSHNIDQTRSCLIQLGAAIVWDNIFVRKVHGILNCINRVGRTEKSSMNKSSIPNEIARHVLGYILDDLLFDTICDALLYISDCSIDASCKRIKSF